MTIMPILIIFFISSTASPGSSHLNSLNSLNSHSCFGSISSPQRSERPRPPVAYKRPRRQHYAARQGAECPTQRCWFAPIKLGGFQPKLKVFSPGEFGPKIYGKKHTHTKSTHVDRLLVVMTDFFFWKYVVQFNYLWEIPWHQSTSLDLEWHGNVIHNMLGNFPMCIPLEPRLTANIPKGGESDAYATDVTPKKTTEIPKKQNVLQLALLWQFPIFPATMSYTLYTGLEVGESYYS